MASKTESTENISTQYYDTEARLKTLRTKQERLQALLAEAEVMEDIISLESALSDVEYEIEQYSSTMNQYDSLVSFSTIDLTLQEVTKVTEEPGETSSLGAKMAAGFSASLEGLKRALVENDETELKRLFVQSTARRRLFDKKREER